MKKLILLFVLGLCMSNHLMAQTDTIWVNGVPKLNKKKNINIEELNPSPLKKDDYLFEVSYGYPFMPLKESNFFGLGNLSSANLIRTIKNSNHICLATDYQLNDEFSVGLELTYASADFEYNRSYTLGTSTIPNRKDTIYAAHAKKIRFLAKISYHLNISERFDAFGTAGFGVKQFVYTTKDSQINNADVSNSIFPVAIRVAIGGRFFLKPNLAIHIEGGLGGPLMQIGLSYKMH